MSDRLKFKVGAHFPARITASPPLTLTQINGVYSFGLAVIPGSGTITGPASSTDNALVRWNGATGTIIKDGPLTVNDNGNIQGARSLEFNEIASPANPVANDVILFAKDVAGITHLFTRDSAGTEIDITQGSGPGGASSGLNYNYLFSNTNMGTDPGAGNIKFNSTTVASINQMAVSHTDRNAIAIAAEITSWSASTTPNNNARIRVFSPTDPTRFIIATISGDEVNAGPYSTFTLTFPTGPGIGAAVPLTAQIEILRTGDVGSAGSPGADGTGSGARYAWSTATAGDPTSGKIGVNNATIASATVLLVNETTFLSQNIGPYINTTWLSSSAIKGTVTIVGIVTPTTFAMFSITAAGTDNGPWDSIPVSFVAGSGAFAANDQVQVFFSRAGDAGSGTVSGGVNNAVAIFGGTTTISQNVALGANQLLEGVAAAAPAAVTVGGDLTLAAGGTFTIANNVVTAAKHAFSTNNRFMGRITAGAGQGEELTGTQATTLLDTFSTAATTKGLVNGSNGGTTLFLRGDNTWASPPTGTITAGGGGTATSGFTAGQLIRSDGTNAQPTTAVTWTANGALQFGVTSAGAGPTTGSIVLANATSAFTTTIQAGVNTTPSRTYTWPINFGAAGTVLTDLAANGGLSWSFAPLSVGNTAIANSTSGRLLYNLSNVLQDTNGMFWDNTNVALGIGTTTPFADNSSRIGQTIASTVAAGIIGLTILNKGTGANTRAALRMLTNTAGVSFEQSVNDSGSTYLAAAGAAIAFFNHQGSQYNWFNQAGSQTWASLTSGALTLGQASALTGQLVLLSSGAAFTTTLQAAAVPTATVAYKWPVNVGSAGQVLSTDGTSGVLSWATTSGGGAPVGATYLTVSNDATLTNERALAAGNGIAFTDGLAGGSFTIAVVAANEATDTTCFPLFATDTTATTGLKTNANLAFNSNTGLLALGANATVAGTLAVTKAFTSGVSALIDGATPALDASLGNTFTLSAAGDRTIAVPTNPTSGQRIVIEHLASGGARTLSLNTGAGGFRFGTDITGLTATTSGKTDYIGCVYNAGGSFWDVVAYTKGF